MNDPAMDKTDIAILNIINQAFPIEPNPYNGICSQLGISENEVMERIKKMRSSGLIRRIGATINPKALGWYSTLCAADIAPEEIDAFALVVNKYAEVTHNYVRSGHPNCWFTLIGQSKKRCEEILDKIRTKTGKNIIDLPAHRVFKIKVGFKL
ncbi:MAG: winged helix-turn-helix transcriptional regulator [Thermodesulfobacteriota bacterium]|nr:winged helix-turn-helix transcriptional regulator [Thermodesulfobacteriota bacterium]